MNVSKDEMERLVKKHYGCIWYVLNKWGLPESEFLDVAILGLYKGIKKFDPKRSKMKLNTYLIFSVEWEIGKEIESYSEFTGYTDKKDNRHYKFFINSYFAIKNCEFHIMENPNENEKEDGDYLLFAQRNRIVEERVFDNISDIETQYFYDNICTEKEAKVCKMRVMGYNFQEIGDELGCSRNNVSLIINKIKKKMIDYFGENNCSNRIPIKIYSKGYGQ